MMNFEGAPPPPPRIVRSIVGLNAVQFAQQFLGLDPDEHQKTVLLSDAKRGILNCSRQWGKSTILAAKAIHRAFTHKGKLVLVASPSLRPLRRRRLHPRTPRSRHRRIHPPPPNRKLALKKMFFTKQSQFPLATRQSDPRASAFICGGNKCASKFRRRQ